MNQLIKKTMDPMLGFFPSHLIDDDIWADFRDVFAAKGLKKTIGRPHNLVNIKDKDGNVTGQRLSLVYTPFSKSDVKIEIEDGILTVLIGGTKNESSESDDYIYHGISSQSTKFCLHIADNVDQSKITAKGEDGMLHIDFPFKEPEKKPPQKIQLTIE